MNVPMRMNGRLGECVLVTYRTPIDSITHLLPDGLEPTRRGDWAFWNIVCCRVEQMRPAGVPAVLGVTFHHVAYRLMVQAMTERAEVVQGLYFQRSDADTRVLGLMGNHLTDFRFHHADVRMESDDSHVAMRVTGTEGAAADARLRVTHMAAALRADSCFPTVEDARAFCRYRPRGLGVQETAEGRFLKIAQVYRDGRAWCETPVAIEEARWDYLESIGQGGLIRPEWAVRINPLVYRWELGGRERLLGSRPLVMSG